MPTFDCPECGKTLKYQEQWSGRKAKCSGCGASVLTPPFQPKSDTAEPPFSVLLRSVGILSILASVLMLAVSPDLFVPTFFGGLFLCWMGVVHWSLKDIRNTLRNQQR